MRVLDRSMKYRKRNAPMEDSIVPVTETGCWLWEGAANNKGYGQFGRHYVHRLMFEKYVRPLTPGEVVMHICDTPCCCNPNHLRAGTPADNTADMLAKKRDALRGDRSRRRKLSATQVRRIRSDKRSNQEVAAAYGISYSHACAIRRGEFWSNL